MTVSYTTAVQEKFLAAAPGQWFDPDKFAGYQCKDVPDAYAMFIFGKPWAETVRPGNGNAVFANANPDYFTKVANDPANAGQLPPRGAIFSIAGSKAVPEGHTGIVLEADRSGMKVLQQDGYKQVAAHVAYLPYDGLIGWLVPKLANDGALGTFTRIVTAASAMVRTGPGTQFALAPAYPNGLAKGATLAVKGYVAGQDPYPNDGSVDNAWYVTKSGYFVWANAAGNSLAALPKL